MGLKSWWKAKSQRAQLTRQSLALNKNDELIRQQVPELTGMSEVEGMAHVMREIEAWNKTCSSDQAATFANKLAASNESFEADGLAMPQWGNLWVLRTYQRQLGLNVPDIAEVTVDHVGQGEAAAQEVMKALALFLEAQIIPRRAAFLKVFEGQLDQLDARIAEMNAIDKTTRAQLAQLDFQILQENWRGRRSEQIAEASAWLDEHLGQAEAIQCSAYLQDAIKHALNRQEAILVKDGLATLLAINLES